MLSVNTDPNCPGAGRAERDNDLGKAIHRDKLRASYCHISKERWEEIFGELETRQGALERDQ